MAVKVNPGYLIRRRTEIIARVIIEKRVITRYTYLKGHYHRSPYAKKTGGNTSLFMVRKGYLSTITRRIQDILLYPVPNDC
jgi:hypothetical protein